MYIVRSMFKCRICLGSSVTRVIMSTWTPTPISITFFHFIVVISADISSLNTFSFCRATFCFSSSRSYLHEMISLLRRSSEIHLCADRSSAYLLGRSACLSVCQVGRRTAGQTQAAGGLTQMWHRCVFGRWRPDGKQMGGRTNSFNYFFSSFLLFSASSPSK